MPHLLNVWPSIARKFQRAGQSLVLFDFDGTLCPIMPHPDDAELSEATRELLRRAVDDDSLIPGVVSGRSLEDLRRRVDVDGLIYAGNHGLEIHGSELGFIHPQASELTDELSRIFLQLERALEGLPGIVGENKRLSLSFHYRLTPDDLIPQVEDLFCRCVTPDVEKGSVKITRGKKVLEVRPNLDWGKGHAIDQINSVCPSAKLAAFFGDDLTDEDGFEVVNRMEGISVMVGPARQPTKAQYRVDSPPEVAQALELLLTLE